MTSTVLCAADLDRTLIYSRAAIVRWGSSGELVAVERYEGEDASWVTATAARGLVALGERGRLLPVTTRTPTQFRRVRLPGAPARYAITSNGGVLLVDDEPDASWTAAVARAVASVAPLSEIWRHAGEVCRPEWTRTLRNADDLFCYAVLERDRLPEGFVAEVATWADARGWRLSLQGRKLYWVPGSLTKSAAVAEVARRVGADVVLGAGDSLLDADLLEAADRGVVARHGELVASGWTAPHVQVTSASGITAGEQIVDWFVRESQ